MISDLLRLGVLYFRSSTAVRAENLVLRRQLAGYVERGIKPRRVDYATRVTLALFTRFFDWRDAVVNASPRPPWFAGTGMADLLALEEQGRPTADSSADPKADPKNGHRESIVGSRADRR